MADYLDDLRLAHVLADAADAATMDRFKALDLKVETKPDMTPVSEADKSAEELIRGQLQRARPRDAVLGEEYGVEGTGPRRWVVDPIDGTKNYVRGVPVWATLIALTEASEGASNPSSAWSPPPRSAAAGGLRRGTARSPGAACPRRPGCASRASRGCPTPPSRTPRSAAGRSAVELNGFLDLTRKVWRTRAYGDFWPYMMVAEGSVDLCAEPELSLWDMAANAIIVTEAGGSFTGLDGRPGPHSGNAAASNGLLHDELLDHLNERY